VYATSQPKDAYGVAVAAKAACSVTTPCDADPTTLVVSPITAACVACHDSTPAKNHMISNGGSFYDTRAVAKTKGEACLVCHGPTSEWPIATVHK
jgi:hypothetical protein